MAKRTLALLAMAILAMAPLAMALFAMSLKTGTVFCFSISPEASLAAMSCRRGVLQVWVHRAAGWVHGAAGWTRRAADAQGYRPHTHGYGLDTKAYLVNDLVAPA